MTDERPLLRRWAVMVRAVNREPEIIYVFSATPVSAGASAAEKLRRRLAAGIDYRGRTRIDVLEVREAP